MNSFIKHFQRELEIMRNNCKGLNKDSEPIILQFEEAMIQLLSHPEFMEQSGGSMPFYAGTVSACLKNTLMFKPLSPLLGDDSEWIDRTEERGSVCFQNNRASNVFRDSKGAYQIDAVVFRDINDKWDSFSGKVDNITSKQYIKSFPFTPETIVIGVRKEENSEEFYKSNPELNWFEAGWTYDHSPNKKVFYHYVLDAPINLDLFKNYNYEERN